MGLRDLFKRKQEQPKDIKVEDEKCFDENELDEAVGGIPYQDARDRMLKEMAQPTPTPRQGWQENQQTGKDTSDREPGDE